MYIKRKGLIFKTLEVTEKKWKAIISEPKSICFGDTIYPLTNHCQNALLIVKALKLVQVTMGWDDNKPMRSRSHTDTRYILGIIKIIGFLNTQESINHNILKKMEIWEITEGNLLPQSCKSRAIEALLKQTIYSNFLSSTEKEQLELILNSYTRSRDTDTEKDSLTQWFTSYSPWLKAELGDQYLLLESPKRIIKSFEVTIGALLLYIFEARKQFDNEPDLIAYYKDIMHQSTFQKGKQICLFLAALYTKPNTKELRDFAKFEFIRQRDRQEFEECIDAYADKDERELFEALYQIFVYKGKALRFISSNYLSEPITTLEQLLMSWLMASLSVQPSDIHKLTRRHFATKKNRNGFPRQLEVTYYKGRSDSTHQTPTLTGSNIVARAVLTYLRVLPPEQDKLFTNKNPISIAPKGFINPLSLSITQEKKTIQRMVALFLVSSHNFEEHLDKELERHNSGKIFQLALSKMLTKDTPDCNELKSKILGKDSKRLTNKDQVKELTERPLPMNYFGLRHIKNTSVYARSDAYRDSDLVNQNSHTSLTEKTSYLTDSNKEYVNRLQRITRMVMQDIESRALRPSIDFINQNAAEKALRTKVEENTNTSNVKINKYGEAFNAHTNNTQDYIIVIENEQTIITMLHYLDNASSNANRIYKANKNFFENTLLVNVEWMHYCLSKFNPVLVRKCSKEYERLSQYNVLPQLFENEIQAGQSL